MGDQQHGPVARRSRTRPRPSRSAVSGSRCAVGSSRTSTGASARSARASTIRWRWPPDSSRPSSPTNVSTPSGSPADPVPDPRAAQCVLDLPVGRVGPGEAHVVPDRRGEQMRVLAGDGDHAPDVVLAVLASIASGHHHASALRIEEAQQEVRDRRLAGAARAEERDALARLEPQGHILDARGPPTGDSAPGPPRARPRTATRAVRLGSPGRAPPPPGRSARVPAGPRRAWPTGSRAASASGVTASNDASASSASSRDQHAVELARRGRRDARRRARRRR